MPTPEATPWVNPKTAEMMKLVEPSSRAVWECQNPGLPYDITEEEARRVIIVKGRAYLCLQDQLARNGRVA